MGIKARWLFSDGQKFYLGKTNTESDFGSTLALKRSVTTRARARATVSSEFLKKILVHVHRLFKRSIELVISACHER